MTRDTTRISGSHAQMLTELRQHDQVAVLETLAGFKHVIADRREAMAGGDGRRLAAPLEAGRNFRRLLDP